MLDKLTAARKDDGGFSLVELLIVIVVLGILAGIVMFGVAGFRQDASNSACKAEMKTISVAATAYLAKNGAFAAADDTAAERLAALQAKNYLEAGVLTWAPNVASISDTGVVADTCPAAS